MIYEHRTYNILPGMWYQFIQRFGEGPIKLFEKYGGKLIGSWATAIGPGPEFIYILEFEDMAHREKFWEAVYGDPVFQQYRLTTEVATSNIRILRPAAHTPAK